VGPPRRAVLLRGLLNRSPSLSREHDLRGEALSFHLRRCGTHQQPPGRRCCRAPAPRPGGSRSPYPAAAPLRSRWTDRVASRARTAPSARRPRRSGARCDYARATWSAVSVHRAGKTALTSTYQLIKCWARWKAAQKAVVWLGCSLRIPPPHGGRGLAGARRKIAPEPRAWERWLTTTRLLWDGRATRPKSPKFADAVPSLTTYPTASPTVRSSRSSIAHGEGPRRARSCDASAQLHG
jgi:hypothetical protein